MNERDGLVNAVRKYLNQQRDLMFEKRWGGGLYTSGGVSDFTGILWAEPWGIPWAIEIKHPNRRGKLLTDQELYAVKYGAAGGRTLIGATSVAEVRGFIEGLRTMAQSQRVPRMGQETVG